MNLKKTLALGLALSGLAAFGAVDTSSFAKKMTITASGTFTSGVAAKLAEGETITNFPVLVRLDATKVDYSNFLRPNGADIMFVQGEGDDAVQLPYEVQTWNPLGESLIWVKVPTLAVDTTFDLYFSSLTASVENAPSDVWSEYVSVLHYEEEGGNGTTLANAANGSLNATGKGESSARTDGLLGGARFNNASGSGIDTGASPKTFGFNGALTFSTWLIHDGAYNWDAILFAGDKFAGLQDDGGFGIQLNDKNREGLYIATGNWNDNDLGRITFSSEWNGGWKFYAVTIEDADTTLSNNSAVNFYAMLDAEYKTGRSGWGDKINNTGKHIAIGNNTTFQGALWRGSFDESRLRMCKSSEAWLTAERLSVAAGAMTYGEVQDLLEASVTLAEGATVVRNADGTFTVTAEVAEGTAAKIEVVFNSTEVLELATDVAAGEPVSKTFAADALPADRIWRASLRASDAQGCLATAEVAGVFMTGAVTVTPIVETAEEETLTAGSFKISRPATATAYALPVTLAIGGTAVNGQTYATVATEYVFEAGVSEIVIPVQVLRDIKTDRETVATFAVAPGQYATDGVVATVTIVNFRDAEIAKFSKMMPLTLKAGVDAFTDGKTIADFPVLVRLAKGANGFDPADVTRSDHADLAFFSSDFSVKLPYEIESWDSEGESRVWVKVPELTDNLTINVLYGSDEAAKNTPSDVWTAYKGVWLLNETEGTARKDSTANKMDGEVVNGRVLITDPSGSIIRNAKQFVTVSMWVKPSAVKTWQWLVDACQAEKDGRWGLQFTNGNELRFWNDGGKEPRISTPDGTVKVGEWVRFDCVYDGGVDRLYVNGMLAGTLEGQNWANGQDRVGDSFAIGGLVDTAKNDNLSTATFRDVRFNDTAMPAEWFKATWAFDNADCFDAGEVVPLEKTEAAVVDYATTAFVDGVSSLVLPLKSGTANVFAVIVKPDGTTETRLVAEAVKGPQSVTLPIADIGPAGWYDVGIRAETEDGDYDKRDPSVRVCTAPVWVKPGVAGSTDGEQAKFIIGRDGDDAVLAESLTVAYLVGGVERSVTIPAGVAAVQVGVEPTDEVTAVTVTLAATLAPIAADKASATVEVFKAKVKPRTYRLVVNDYTGETLTDFPALVRLGEGVAGFSYDYVRDWANGGDIRFLSPDRKTVLPHEIDFWNTTGESTVWVKIPRLAKGEAILMEVGGALVTGNVPSDVWSDQVSVYHLTYGRTGAPQGAGYYANAAYADVRTMRGFDTGNLVRTTGKIGEGQLLSTAGQGQNDQHYIEMSENAIMTNLTSTFTASLWMKYAVPKQMTGDDRLISHKGEWNAGNGFEITLSNGNPSSLQVRGVGNATANAANAFPDGANSGDWYHVVAAFNDTSVKMYVNGAEVHVEGSIGAATTDGSHALTIGNGITHKYSTFKGTVDEVRLTTGNLTAARIKADYETVANANFFRMGEYRPGFIVIIK